MPYIENPKTKGSGIICAIPHSDTCPHNCSDCFFQSGRSYLEPLNENLPNMPPIEITENKIVRVNDGNDSSNNIDMVIESCKQYKHKFYNTSNPFFLDKFDAPVVLTLNPGKTTDVTFHKIIEVPKNLMFVRFRTNMWNKSLLCNAIDYYNKKEVPIVLTFMAYFKGSIPKGYECFYEFRKRTLNSYWAIKRSAYEEIMSIFKYDKYAYSCGRETIASGCNMCGNCLREYYSTICRMENK